MVGVEGAASSYGSGRVVCTAPPFGAKPLLGHEEISIRQGSFTCDEFNDRRGKNTGSDWPRVLDAPLVAVTACDRLATAATLAWYSATAQRHPNMRMYRPALSRHVALEHHAVREGLNFTMLSLSPFYLTIRSSLYTDGR